MCLSIREWWQQTATAACEQGRWSLVWTWGEMRTPWVCCLVPFTATRKVCTAWGRSSYQKYKLLNSWAWEYGATFEKLNSEKDERLWTCLHLGQMGQWVCLLHATHGDLRREDQIIQDGKWAGDHPAWPGCGHFSCPVLSFATNHPAKTRQEQLQFTYIWRMVTSALSMVKFTATNQYVFFRQRTITHFGYWRISGRDHIFCDWKAEHLNCFFTGMRAGVQLLKFSELALVLGYRGRVWVFIMWVKKGPHIKPEELKGGGHDRPYKLRDRK